MTATDCPENAFIAVLAHACETRAAGRSANTDGVRAKWRSPAATTTRSTRVRSPSHSVSSKPPSSSRTRSTLRGSRSGTTWSLNQLPYSRKASNGRTLPSSRPWAPAQLLSDSSPRGSLRLEARGEERSSIPPGMPSRQNAIASPNATVGTPASRRCATADRPYGPAPMTATVGVGEED